MTLNKPALALHPQPRYTKHRSVGLFRCWSAPTLTTTETTRRADQPTDQPCDSLLRRSAFSIGDNV